MEINVQSLLFLNIRKNARAHDSLLIVGSIALHALSCAPDTHTHTHTRSSLYYLSCSEVTEKSFIISVNYNVAMKTNKEQPD